MSRRVRNLILTGLALALGLFSAAGLRWGEFTTMEAADWSMAVTLPDSTSTSFGVAVIDPCPRGAPPGPGLTADEIELLVVESAHDVTISAKVPVTRRRNSACNARLDAVSIEISLEAPLGERKLLDGQFDPPRSPTFDVWDHIRPSSPNATGIESS